MRTLWARLWSANPAVVDGVIGAVVAITSLLAMFLGDDPANRRDGDALGVLMVLIASAALARRRVDPMRMLWTVGVATAVLFLRAYPEGTVHIAFAIAAWTAATRSPDTQLSRVAGAGVPLIPLAYIQNSQPSSVGNAFTIAVFVAGAAITGHNVRLRREKRAQEVLTREAEAGRAVSDERLRIARELHDVVAHAMSIVAVQAGVAAHVIDDQPDEAKRMLENVRVTSHEALDEMRRLLGVLRGGDASLAPAPGLGDVEDLVASMRDSGIPTALRVDGVPDAVPAGVELTAYRIVQEALTNVLKHAGPASATVDVHHAPGLVIVEVADDGRGAVLATSGGHGLLGMRERVAVYDGELVAGPKPGGGYRVRATLPYEAAP